MPKQILLPGAPAPTYRPPAHVYAVAPRNDGSWGVWCYACSETAGDYVYPCRELPSKMNPARVPPAVLAELPQLGDYQRLATAENALAHIADLLGLFTDGAEKVNTADIYQAIKDLNDNQRDEL